MAPFLLFNLQQGMVWAPVHVKMSYVPVPGKY